MAVDTKVKTTVDVAIVGGGPTGLLSALLLQQLGISVAVFDAKPGPLKLGRADALNARTQQYLRVTGILDELLEQGIRCNTSSTFADGEFKSRQNAWWTSITHCEFPNFLMIGQPVIEEVLLSKLAPGTVYHSEEVIRITEDGDLASPEGFVTIETASGHTVRSQFAIGADGARSNIRNFLDISFTGTKPEMTWAVLDTFIDTDFPECSEIITFQLDGQSRVSWIPRERGMARFYVLLDEDITQQRAEESIRQHMAPHTIHFRETEWFSTFEIKERIASSFISRDGRGRVFLAGDSAHVHSVNGGQGLNTGLADAFALAWRLAAVIHHNTKALPEKTACRILRSYDAERRAIAQDVINVAAALVRDTMHSAKQYVGTIEKNAGYITGMGVSYAGVGSDLLVPSCEGIWTAGQRCPDIEVVKDAQPGANRLYSLLSYGQWLILSIGGASSVDDDGLMRAALPAQHFTLLPMQSSEEKVTALEAQAASPESGTLRSKDVEPSGNRFVAVVRPDMYIGYVGDASGAKSYLEENCLAA